MSEWHINILYISTFVVKIPSTLCMKSLICYTNVLRFGQVFITLCEYIMFSWICFLPALPNHYMWHIFLYSTLVTYHIHQYHPWIYLPYLIYDFFMNADLILYSILCILVFFMHFLRVVNLFSSSILLLYIDLIDKLFTCFMLNLLILSVVILLGLVVVLLSCFHVNHVYFFAFLINFIQ